MPKKSTVARQAHAARRSQTAARSQNVALVRAPGVGVSSDTSTADPVAASSSTTSATTEKSASSVATAPASRPASSASKSATRTATAARPATSAKPAAKPVAASQGQHAVREQEKRVARAREMRRVRQANVVTAEHYRYVIHDLRLTGILAAAMFAVIVVLHFVLG